MVALWAMLACGGGQVPELEGTAPDSPQIQDLQVSLPHSVDVGESVSIDLSYTLATSCWTTRTILTEPEPHQLVQTTTYEPRDGKCPQVPSPHESTLTIDADEPGDWSLTLILDGQERVQRSFTVNPA